MNTILPIYYQIKETVKGWIINKEFKLGEKIPSENELAEKFNVSRLTVRQAISQLTQEGFLNRKRGKGTFVTANENLINSFGLEFRGLMDDLFFYQISKIQIKSVTINRVVPSKTIRNKLELSNEEKEVVQIKRVRFLRNRLFTYTINYLPIEIGMQINEKDLYKKPILQILEQDLKIRFTEAFQMVEASFADQEVAEKLNILSGSPILFVERIMYAKNRRPVEIFQSSYRADIYKFIIRFIKIKAKKGTEWVSTEVNNK